MNHDDQYNSKLLTNGDYFGETEMLKCIGYEWFGDIYVESTDFECLYISIEDF